MRLVHSIIQRYWILLTFVEFLIEPCRGSSPINAPVSVFSQPRKDSIDLVVSRCRRGGGEGNTLATTTQEGINPLVLLSPVVAAAVCCDGIVLLSIHGPSVTLSQEDNDDDHEDETTTATTTLKDLPIDCSGPFRIQSLDLQGNTLLTAGWRADANYFTKKAQEIVKNERGMVGSVLPARVLASQFSLLLATSAIGGNVSTNFSFYTRV